MKKIFKNPWIRLGIIVGLMGAAIISLQLAKIDYSGITVERFKDKLVSFGVWGGVIYIVFYILHPLVLFPASVLSASAGAIWGIHGLIYLLVGANLSANLEFLIARYFARDAVKRLLQGKLSGFEAALKSQGFFTVLLIRLVPNLPYDIQNLGLGITSVRYRDFFWATLIGIIPGSFALVYFGSSLISVLIDPRYIGKIILALIILGGLYGLQRYVNQRRLAKSPVGKQK